MRISLLPTTPSGRWAAGLMAAFVVLLFLKMRTVGALPLPTPLLFPLAIVAFVLGVAAVLKYKERSAVVFLVLALGGLAVLFALGELLFPH